MNAETYAVRNFIEIEAGKVTESTDPVLLGTFRIFVTYLDEVGGRLCIRDGVSHADAIAIARASASEFNGPFVDRIGAVH